MGVGGKGWEKEDPQSSKDQLHQCVALVQDAGDASKTLLAHNFLLVLVYARGTTQGLTHARHVFYH